MLPVPPVTPLLGVAGLEVRGDEVDARERAEGQRRPARAGSGVVDRDDAYRARFVGMVEDPHHALLSAGGRRDEQRQPVLLRQRRRGGGQEAAPGRVAEGRAPRRAGQSPPVRRSTTNAARRGLPCPAGKAGGGGAAVGAGDRRGPSSECLPGRGFPADSRKHAHEKYVHLSIKFANCSRIPGGFAAWREPCLAVGTKDGLRGHEFRAPAPGWPAPITLVYHRKRVNSMALAPCGPGGWLCQ